MPLARLIRASHALKLPSLTISGVQLAILSAPRRRSCRASGSARRESAPGRNSAAGNGTAVLADRSAAAAVWGMATVLPRIVTLAVLSDTSWNVAALWTASSLVSASMPSAVSFPGRARPAARHGRSARPVDSPQEYEYQATRIIGVVDSSAGPGSREGKSLRKEVNELSL